MARTIENRHLPKSAPPHSSAGAGQTIDDIMISRGIRPPKSAAEVRADPAQRFNIFKLLEYLKRLPYMMTRRETLPFMYGLAQLFQKHAQEAMANPQPNILDFTVTGIGLNYP